MSIWDEPPLHTNTNQGFVEGITSEQHPKKETSANLMGIGSKHSDFNSLIEHERFVSYMV